MGGHIVVLIIVINYTTQHGGGVGAFITLLDDVHDRAAILNLYMYIPPFKLYVIYFRTLMKIDFPIILTDGITSMCIITDRKIDI